MTAGHEFGHGTNPVQLNQRRALAWVVGVNAALLIVEVVGGVVFGSLALITDAAHLLSDVAGLCIALAGLTLAATVGLNRAVLAGVAHLPGQFHLHRRPEKELALGDPGPLAFSFLFIR